MAGVHDRRDYALLATGVLCASTSPPLIAATAAPALAIAFWRTGAAALILLPAMLARREHLRLPRRAALLAVLAGAALAAHFGTFIPSLSYTSVASSAALVCSQAVWAALLGRALGERLPGRAWLGTAVCLSGVLLITGVDVSLSGDALLGDSLALLGGVFGGVYIVTGGFVRRELSTLSYTLICYGVCGVLLLAVCVIGGQPLAGYAADDWVRIAALTVLRPAARPLAVQPRAALDQPDDRLARVAVHGAAGRDHRRGRARADAARGGGPGARIAARRDRARDQRARASCRQR